MSKHTISTDAQPGMFDKAQNVKRVLYALFTCVVLLLSIDLFYHKHGIFTWESSFGFYSVYGFVACVILVIIAKYVLRPLVMRKEDYYND